MLGRKEEVRGKKCKRVGKLGTQLLFIGRIGSVQGCWEGAIVLAIWQAKL